MSRRCLLFVSSAVLGLSALVLSLSACGSSSSAAPVSPASSYTLTAAALKPGRSPQETRPLPPSR